MSIDKNPLFLSVSSSRFLVWIRRDYPSLILCFWFILGNLTFSIMPLQISTLVIILIGIIGMLIVRPRVITFCFALGLLSSIGLQFRGNISSNNLQLVLLSVAERPRFSVTGEIKFQATTQLLKSNFSGTTFSKLSLETSEMTLLCSGIDLPWENAQKIKKGDRLIALVDIKSINQNFKPFSYDSQLWRQGIQGRCKIRAATHSMYARHSIIDRMRLWLITSAKAALGDNESTELVLAMAIGIRDGLSLKTERAMRYLGLTHVLVVSGYQFGLIFGLLVGLGYILRLILPTALVAHRIRKLSLLLCIILMFAYAILVGENVSTTRAFFALICLVGSIFSERGYSMINTMAIALVALTIIWPGTILEVGAQLTFVALLGIVLALAYSSYANWPLWVTVPVLATLATQVVCLLWFQQLSLWSIVMNLLVVPIVTLLICNLGFIGLLLLPLSNTLALVVLQVSWYSAYYLRSFAWWVEQSRVGYYELEWQTCLFIALIIAAFLFSLWLKVLVVYLQQRRIFRYPKQYKALSFL